METRAAVLTTTWRFLPTAAPPSLARSLVLALGVAYVGLPVAAEAQSPSTIKANFVCAAGKSVAAVFDNGANSSVKLTLSDGRELVLPQAMSASGARYTNSGESVVFWNKGNTAFIEENGKKTFRGCTVKR